MNKILKILNNWKVIIVILLIAGGLFYWYEWRPSRVYIECQHKAKKWFKNYSEDKLESKFTSDKERAYNFIYENCLRQKGIDE